MTPEAKRLRDALRLLGVTPEPMGSVDTGGGPVRFPTTLAHLAWLMDACAAPPPSSALSVTVNVPLVVKEVGRWKGDYGVRFAMPDAPHRSYVVQMPQEDTVAWGQRLYATVNGRMTITVGVIPNDHDP